MIAHVVLFQPKPELTDEERRTFVRALEQALTSVGGIARARLGRRLTLGRPYDAQGPPFSYAAILEFASEADLRAYLDHPAHEALGAQFYSASAAALAGDFTLIDGDRAAELLNDRRL